MFAEALHGIPDVIGPNLAVRAQHLRADDRRTVAQLVAARGHRQSQGDHLPSPGVAVTHPHIPLVTGWESPTRLYPGATGLGPAPRVCPVSPASLGNSGLLGLVRDRVRLWYGFYGTVMESEAAFDGKIDELCREPGEKGRSIVS